MERISACVRMHHPQYSNEAIERHLDACAENGSIQKVKRATENIISKVETCSLGMQKLFLVAAKQTSIVEINFLSFRHWVQKGPKQSKQAF